jgi:cytoskeletal protein RodZ
MKVRTTNILKTLSLLTITIVVSYFANPIYAQNQKVATRSIADQEMTVTGKVTDEKGPLSGVNIVLKGSKVGVITDINGMYTFPKSLSSGDVLVFSFLGYDKQEVKIESKTTVVNIVMSDNYIEIMGAPSTNQPYKSKRSH